ncbi:hypothetical protein LOK49_LG01G02325 [Camellia lanceoleosa]|uniref:Uncharacterized protein n=1 Tax=Camellia lanceoleosa TaxID=1840588 RepID=A0ACC0IWE8_9ERIC|nr:hypothetical protein LOK49_LG01G02325 [Camellia lanceoleosa]
MERKPQRSTADLLTWSEEIRPSTHSSPIVSSRSHHHLPPDGISNTLYGGLVTDHESYTLNQWKPCSGYKLKDITGSKIFAGEDGGPESTNAYYNHNNRTGLHTYQQAINGISQISFSMEEKVSPQKLNTLSEAAKQRELSGTLESDLDAKTQKQPSDAKCKELSGHDIFGAPPEIPPRSLAAVRSLEATESKDIAEPALRNVRTSVKVSNPAGGQSNIRFSEEPVIKNVQKTHDQKFAEPTGTGIFKGDVPPGSAEKPWSNAKLREMSGNDIFGDGKAESRDHLGGIRQPPGGESSIALV